MNPEPYANNERKSAISGTTMVITGLLVWLIVLIVGFIQLQHYTRGEIRHETARLKQNLRLEAEYQQAALEQWLRGKCTAIEALASNTALQLYLTTLTMANSADNAATAESNYLMNYLLATAEQAGFNPPLREIDTRRANTGQRPSAGIGIVDTSGKLLLASGALPEVAPLLALFTEAANSNTGTPPMASIAGPYLTAEKTPLLVIKMPVFAVQADMHNDAPIGTILATALLTGPFTTMLEPPLGKDSGAISHLFRHGNDAEDAFERIASTSGITAAPVASPVEQQALTKFRHFITRSNEVGTRELALALPIANAPGKGGWTLLRIMDQSTALAGVTSRANWLHATYWLVALSFTLIALLLWRSATAWRLQSLLSRLSAHETLLRIVTDSLPVRLFILDRQKHLRFANQPAAAHNGMEPAAMIGKSTENILGRAASDQLAEPIARTILQQAPQRDWKETLDADGEPLMLERSFVPLPNLPGTTESQLPAVLVMEHDITSLVQAQKAHQQMLNKLVDTLVMLADQRDPHSSRHSGGVSMVARAIASAMHRPADEVDTVTLAGRLVNLGKLMVPDSLLTSEKKLEKGDRALFDDSYQKLLSYLEDVPFQLPVVPTLKQLHERQDGDGPLKLKAEETLVTAKILTIAHSYVALISPRAYRKALSMEQALLELEKEPNYYAAEIVTALRHYLENLGGYTEWKDYAAA